MTLTDTYDELDVPPALHEFPGDDWPAKFEELRPHQWDAIRNVQLMFDSGVKVVVLDAPTGSGKTLIAEAVRRLQGPARALYVCHSKTLQDQFEADFDYSRVVKGKANYKPISFHNNIPDEVTCDDCTAIGDVACMWCDDVGQCPAKVAKARALGAPLAVINTSYFLTEANYVGAIQKRRGLIVFDECDTLESELMGFVEFAISGVRLKRLGLDAPKKATRMKNVAKWMLDEFVPRAETMALREPDTVQGRRNRHRLAVLGTSAYLVAKQLFADEDSEDTWVRDYGRDDGGLYLKPVTVKGYGEKYLWQHGEKFLAMSASVISVDEWCDSLGLDSDEVGLIEVPMTFPVENRAVILAPIARNVQKEYEASLPKLAHAIINVARLHPDDRILVHTVSYKFAKDLWLLLRTRIPDRAVMTYATSSEKDDVVAQYRKTTRAIMLAPSLDRGIDFANEECRVQVIAKVPYPYLGDRQVAARLNAPGGQLWYATQMIRSVVQMTGRAVRGPEDHATTYIIDEEFMRSFRQYRHLFPGWWRAAIRTDFPVRELVK